MSWCTSEACLILLFLLALAAVEFIRRLIQSGAERGGLPLPPGPCLLPLLGSALSIDIKEPWETYNQWRATYGDIIYARLLDQEVVILSSQSDAVELFEKRSKIYSDRPFLATTEPFGLDFNFALLAYGDHWRLCRRIFHETFREKAASSFRPMQLRKAHEMVENLIDDPTDYHSHYTTFAASVVMSAVYGYEPCHQDDPMVHIVERFLQYLIQEATPEKAMVLKVLPFLLYLPDCFLGSYKMKSKFARKCSQEMIEVPYQYAEQQRFMGSMVSEHLTRMQDYDEPHRAQYLATLKEVSATSSSVALETTSSTLMTFTLAMVMNAHVWKRAQAEIDAVVGIDRLPEYDDRPSLPYIDAIVRETVRWQPIVPLGVPHATVSSDIFKGFYIPKGATVIANTWAMSRDETRCPNAAEFVPERFLNADGTLTDDDPNSFVFGFGRRICPGRHVGDASLWISIVTMLAVLDFSGPKDNEGKDTEIYPAYVNIGLAHRPAIFPCSISPRAHITKETLRRMV